MDKLEEKILICEALGIDKIKLAAHPELENSNNPKLAEFKKRCSENEPLAYIVGHQPFMDLDFLVDRSVLIPRPETEEMVNYILKSQISDTTSQYGIKILDIGTGSGCIAITLAKYLPQAKVWATDTSNEALNIAKKNAKKHEVVDKIKFIEGDLFADIKEKFDIIISNPPYIPTSDIKTLDANVKDFEPRDALDGGKDGLDIIRKIIENAYSYLKKDGIIMLELEFRQSEKVKNLLKNKGYKNIEIIKDSAEINRMAKAYF
ncbi:protein-(glutamine-N5) methyltransferase, release factor-specific [candidate division WOR-1 bacterium RIFOXYA2_FULL_36_21]|uniref:Release factor glutamine methyltransferase n=1 Tax=candidate division WOR-1 bacterium RIFOXYB2_FULL_36_35 TaxID=1802578 RepID=A0A1F4S793_UNCSA|nr:MAG: protein-(glutamine-N5) methyltransferase, release factor-specific [candidate division WOR-1 bacterium RIFOXYA2_FULL_36_21]OGC15696.1 MAG: protein-(glutamine-N5) methyltransferase, release factor-specific [candidate division WOR-1 bacterium RIFOXYA12_FULL_36_13]OGC16306.1 MAG: protein-(glutamine-N5) methyltransferase, release factor-specific [candidate division WOR-1 bacterium RIFOXYB2_FULL_36_35]